MKNFFNKVWAALKREFMMFLISTWHVWIALIIATIVGWIFGWHLMVWVFFGLVLGFISLIFLRQIYWWFTGKVDYIGRGFPALWKKIFKK